jgi:hypothetical protein
MQVKVHPLEVPIVVPTWYAVSRVLCVPYYDVDSTAAFEDVVEHHVYELDRTNPAPRAVQLMPLELADPTLTENAAESVVAVLSGAYRQRY